MFPGVKVKLDLFHGVQRVTRTISKGTEFSAKFSKEFGQIFRANGDFGDKRTSSTPQPNILNENLDNFLKRWKAILEENNLGRTLIEIENLRKHIDNGCLSGLEPGEGTECNESLHHTLNNSLVAGVTTIGPELIVALLSLLFYGVNSKRKGNQHKGNSRVIPFVPVLNSNEEVQQARKKRVPYFKSESMEEMTLSSVWKSQGISNEDQGDITSDDIVIIENIDDMCNETVSALLLRQTRAMYNILNSINANCNDRCINVYELPVMQVSSIKQVLVANDNVSDMAELDKNLLQRNLLSFNRTINPVAGDRDCAFRSILLQLRETKEWMEHDELLIQHLHSLGLGMSIDEDVFQLRQLFVDHIQSNDSYQMLIGIPLLDLNDETERFREEGTFCGEVGDLVIKVCSDILRVPIMVITSIVGTPYLPFIPDESVTDQPLFIAFTASGAGHYDGTNKIEKERGKPLNSHSQIIRLKIKTLFRRKKQTGQLRK